MKGWYYWRRTNLGNHFIVFRRAEERCATASIIPSPDGTFTYKVAHRSKTIVSGRANALSDAKYGVSQVVNKIIREEYRKEYMPYFG